ncbi:MAG: RNase P subunit p30 family protein [Promethearchaeota archaeon]
MSYYECRVKVNIKDIESVKEILKMYKILGVRNLILEPIFLNKYNISNEIKEQIQSLTKINIFYRYNLKIDNLTKFKQIIRKFNDSPLIISVESQNKDVQINAARDSRVDILSFSEPNILKTLTPGVISLIKQNQSFIEYSLAPILSNKNKSLLSKNFRMLYRYMRLGIKAHVNYIISGNFTNLWDYRHPRALISICNSLLGLSLTEAKKGFIENPKKLIERVKNRIDKNYFESGVRIIEIDP